MVITTHLTVTPLTVIHLPATPISAIRPAVQGMTRTETVLGFVTIPAIPPVIRPVIRPVTLMTVHTTQEVEVAVQTQVEHLPPHKIVLPMLEAQVAQVAEHMVCVEETVVVVVEPKELGQMALSQQVQVQL
jgi:hypothetical protein